MYNKSRRFTFTGMTIEMLENIRQYLTLKRLLYILGLAALILILTGCQTKSTFGLQGHTTLRLYFPQTGKIALGVEELVIPKLDTASTARLAIKEIWDKAEREAVVGLFPQVSDSIRVSVHGETAVVDLPGEVRDKHIGGTTGELMTVYSIVNTLTGIDGINSVKFLIDGKLTDSFKGHLDFSAAFSADKNI